MNVKDCPEWEYANHPKRAAILKHKAAILLIQMRQQNFDAADNASDSRLVHRFLFSDLTPPQHDYFAGHYRGEDFFCLRHYNANIPSDPRVGYHPRVVPEKMAQLTEWIELGIKALDTAYQLPEDQLSPADHLLNTVAFTCKVFEEILRVHPYANGNGHAARFVVWAILGRYGYWPKHFSLHPSPPDIPYTDCILQYRNGNTQPLEEYLLKSIIG